MDYTFIFLTVVPFDSLVLTIVSTSRWTLLVGLIPHPDVMVMSSVAATLTPHKDSLDSLLTDSTEVGDLVASSTEPGSVFPAQGFTAGRTV